MTDIGILLEQFVPGIPKAQPRPRAFTIGGRPRVYNAATAEGWKNCLATALQAHRPESPIEGPVRVDVTFFLPRPKAHYRTGRHAGELKPSAPVFHTSKPDRDNLDKAVLDTLKTLQFYREDSQVCAGEIVKLYEDGEGPGCRITISINI